jgi:hypothetical protein
MLRNLITILCIFMLHFFSSAKEYFSPPKTLMSSSSSPNQKDDSLSTLQEQHFNGDNEPDDDQTGVPTITKAVTRTSKNKGSATQHQQLSDDDDGDLSEDNEVDHEEDNEYEEDGEEEDGEEEGGKEDGNEDNNESDDAGDNNDEDEEKNFKEDEEFSPQEFINLLVEVAHEHDLSLKSFLGTLMSPSEVKRGVGVGNVGVRIHTDHEVVDLTLNADLPPTASWISQAVGPDMYRASFDDMRTVVSKNKR